MLYERMIVSLIPMHHESEHFCQSRFKITLSHVLLEYMAEWMVLAQ